MCVCVRVTFVLFTDCDSCTTPISTNPGSMEAGECGLTRGTCFAARRLELFAVAGLLWISWCVLGAAGFFCVFFPPVFFSSNAHGLLQVRGHLASCTSLLVGMHIRRVGATAFKYTHHALSFKYVYALRHSSTHIQSVECWVLRHSSTHVIMTIRTTSVRNFDVWCYEDHACGFGGTNML